MFSLNCKSLVSSFSLGVIGKILIDFWVNILVYREMFKNFKIPTQYLPLFLPGLSEHSYEDPLALVYRWVGENLAPG